MSKKRNMTAEQALELCLLLVCIHLSCFCHFWANKEWCDKEKKVYFFMNKIHFYDQICIKFSISLRYSIFKFFCQPMPNGAKIGTDGLRLDFSHKNRHHCYIFCCVDIIHVPKCQREWVVTFFDVILLLYWENKICHVHLSVFFLGGIMFWGIKTQNYSFTLLLTWFFSHPQCQQLPI